MERACSEDLGKLFNNELYSDLILNVDGTKFFAHKNILAIRSEYFRTMLASDMSESSKKEIPIVESNVKLFEKLLRYIYTGQWEFTTNVIESIQKLSIANKYLFWGLQRSIERDLEVMLCAKNFYTIYSGALSCSAENLMRKCFNIASDRPVAIIRKDGFSNLPVDAIMKLIAQKSFDKYQSEVFTAVSKWITKNGGKENCAEAADILLSEIKLERIPINFLKESVRPSGLFPDARILDAILEAHGECEMIKTGND